MAFEHLLLMSYRHAPWMPLSYHLDTVLIARRLLNEKSS